MPNQRRAGQKAVIVMIQEDFLEMIDSALPAMGYSDRSSFIRDAVRDQLERDGVMVPKAAAAAPYRAGKGRKKPKISYHKKDEQTNK